MTEGSWTSLGLDDFITNGTKIVKIGNQAYMASKFVK
jgi:hypothetical protein